MQLGSTKIVSNPISRLHLSIRGFPWDSAHFHYGAVFKVDYFFLYSISPIKPKIYRGSIEILIKINIKNVDSKSPY